MKRNYEIQEIKHLDDHLEKKIIEMQEKAYGKTFAQNAISQNTTNNYIDIKPLHLGAFQEGQLIGYNAFTPHYFYKGQKRYTGYQSGWSITDPDLKVWGAFFDLINTGKKILKEERKADFIFGFPNHNSEPIFTKRLKFTSSKLCTGKILSNNLIISQSITNSQKFENSNSYTPFKEQYYFKEEARPNDSFHLFEFEGDFVWGKVRTNKKMGVSISYFDFGGVKISTASNLKTLLKKVNKNLNIQYIQIVTHPSSVLAHFIPKLSESDKTEPFIVFDLQGEGHNANQFFNICSGIKDVF